LQGPKKRRPPEDLTRLAVEIGDATNRRGGEIVKRVYRLGTISNPFFGGTRSRRHFGEKTVGGEGYWVGGQKKTTISNQFRMRGTAAKVSLSGLSFKRWTLIKKKEGGPGKKEGSCKGEARKGGFQKGRKYK